MTDDTTAMTTEGATSNGGIRSWEPARRRTSSIAALGLAVGVAIVALVTWYLAPNASWTAWLFWGLVALLVLTLAFIVLLIVMGGAPSRAAAPESASAEPHMGPAGPAPMGAAAAVATMTLRCGDCGTVFDITDTGERPLYHTCPGCGAQGVLNAELAAPPMMTPEPAAPEAAPMAPEPEPAAPAATPRRLKLRCGGCKEVFVIEDTGERPLRRPCPHCGRMGEIR